MTTEIFLRDVKILAVVCTEPAKDVFKIFLINSITLRKDCLRGVEHEYLVVDILHTDSPSASLAMFLERTASDSHPSADELKKNPENAAIMEGLIDTLRERTLKPSSSTYHIIDSSDSTTTSRDDSTLSFMDKFSLLSIGVAHVSSQSFSKVYRADDRWTGGQEAASYASSARIVRQISPVSLSLFDLAVLADTVHIHDSTYSIFKSHCYWFANIICDVIEKEYNCTIGAKDELDMDDICIPPNHYLPDLAGRWMGVRVIEVKAAVVSSMASKFQEHHKKMLEETEKGSFFSFISS